MRVRRVLWPTDFSACADAALDHAIEMAARHQAALDLLHVVVLGDEDPFQPPDRLPGRTEIQRRLRRISTRNSNRPIAGWSTPIGVDRHLRRAHAAASDILRFSTEKTVDLIVLGGHGQSGFRPSFLGSVAEEVVRLAPCPVLSVREPAGETSSGVPDAGTGAIVVPIDFSDRSAVALRAAKGLAVVLGVRLDIVHVVEPASGPRVSGAEDVPRPRIEERLSELVDEILGRPRVEYRVAVIEGIAAASITAHAAASSAGLIVIATQGLTGQRHFLLDSVTEKVVRTATCPVLTLKGPRAPDAHEGAAAGLA